MQTLRFATWNINSLRVRLPQVLSWLQDKNIDILAMQELKMDHQEFPIQSFLDVGYHGVWFGQKTYNGVAVVAKQHITLDDVTYGMEHYADEQRRVISVTVNRKIRLINAYVVNGESVSSPKFLYKQEWLKYFLMHVQEQKIRHTHPCLVVGDFNIAPDDRDVYDPEAWRGSVLCSEFERSWFCALLNDGFEDMLRTFHPLDHDVYTWWDYRGMMFRRKKGLRIDHMLADSELAKQVIHCHVDLDPRGNERPSDHAPVILECRIDEC
jgi:exodeoxyribonuclease-3